MAKRDYYEVLGVNKSASEDELKAYRSWRKYHPDVNRDNPERSGRSSRKSTKRTQCCQMLISVRGMISLDMPPLNQTGGPQGGYFQGDFGGFSDIFDMFAGRSGFGGRRPRRMDRNRAPTCATI